MDGQGTELLEKVLKQRKEEKRKLEEAELSEYEKRKRTELSEREEYRQYLVLKQMEIIWFSYDNADAYKLRKVAEELLDRLATEHRIINYPKDYSLIREWEAERAYLTASKDDRMSAHMKADLKLELDDLDKRLAKVGEEISHGVSDSRRAEVDKELEDIGNRQKALSDRPTSIQELRKRKEDVQRRIASLKAKKEELLKAKTVAATVEPDIVVQKKRGKKQD